MPRFFFNFFNNKRDKHFESCLELDIGHGETSS
jgi:hypothetical protein